MSRVPVRGIAPVARPQQRWLRHRSPGALCTQDGHGGRGIPSHQLLLFGRIELFKCVYQLRPGMGRSFHEARTKVIDNRSEDGESDRRLCRPLTMTQRFTAVSHVRKQVCDDRIVHLIQRGRSPAENPGEMIPESIAQPKSAHGSESGLLRQCRKVLLVLRR